MFGRLARQAARRALPRVVGGPDRLERLALDSLDVRAETVLRGYLAGHFPMPDATGRLRWQFPPRRGVIPIDGFHVPKSVARLVRSGRFDVRYDTEVEQVIRACAERETTWITEEIVQIYLRLHEWGVVHSVETWEDEQLVGGLYGVTIGGYFAGESQFHRARDAGKVAFTVLAERLREGGFLLHDTQHRTEYLAQFGCIEISAEEFRDQLVRAIASPATFLR